jgi:hypothetical protein
MEQARVWLGGGTPTPKYVKVPGPAPLVTKGKKRGLGHLGHIGEGLGHALGPPNIVEGTFVSKLGAKALGMALIF